MAANSKPRSALNAAEKATREVQDHVAKAVAILNRARVNALGVYLDPRGRLADLQEAKEVLDAAARNMRGTAWPTEADYNKA